MVPCLSSSNHHAVFIGDGCLNLITLCIFIDSPAVRQALHVPSEAFYGHPFSLLSTTLVYSSNVGSLFGLYKRIIPRVKVLVYNGDLDPCVPYNGNEEWTRGLGLP